MKKDKQVINDELIGSVLKTERLISDYTLTENNKEKDIFLELTGNYIYKLSRPDMELIYQKICDSSEEEKDLYIEILFDLIDALKSELI